MNEVSPLSISAEFPFLVSGKRVFYFYFFSKGLFGYLFQSKIDIYSIVHVYMCGFSFYCCNGNLKIMRYFQLLSRCSHKGGGAHRARRRRRRRRNAQKSARNRRTVSPSICGSSSSACCCCCKFSMLLACQRPHQQSPEPRDFHFSFSYF
uniref:Uncharacterized protein n=1 Tax=Rhizophora mucronata TaxID=61149 RepID=A0A2P2LN28_RHIMU